METNSYDWLGAYISLENAFRCLDNGDNSGYAAWVKAHNDILVQTWQRRKKSFRELFVVFVLRIAGVHN